jgi:hypothetical protein
MSSRTITKLSLFLFVMLFGLLSSSVSGQRLQSKLDQRVKAFDSESASTVDQLIEFAQRFEIPLGIEWMDNSNAKAAPPIHARNSTAKRILEQIVHENSGNDFILTAGVVHVYSPKIIGDDRNFLNLRVPHFQVTNESLLGADFLLRVSIRQALNPRSGGYGGGHGHGIPRSDTFDIRNLGFSLHNATVRQILNTIVARQGNAFWVVRIKPLEVMGNGRFYVQTASATSKETAPDFHWDFMPLKDLTAK